MMSQVCASLLQVSSPAFCFSAAERFPGLSRRTIPSPQPDRSLALWQRTTDMV